MSNGLVAKKLTVKRSVHALVEMLKRDPDYKRTWKDNISMMYQDEFKGLGGNDGMYPREELKIKCDKAADNFLNVLMDAV